MIEGDGLRRKFIKRSVNDVVIQSKVVKKGNVFFVPHFGEAMADFYDIINQFPREWWTRLFPKPQKTYTYFIQKGQTGPIKIGIAANPSSRLSALQTASSEKLRLICVYPDNIEAEIHKLFMKYRLKGEWFRNTPGLIQLLSWQLQFYLDENFKCHSLSPLRSFILGAYDLQMTKRILGE